MSFLARSDRFVLVVAALLAMQQGAATRSPLAKIETIDDEIPGQLVSIDLERGRLQIEQDSFTTIPIANALTITLDTRATSDRQKQLIQTIGDSEFSYQTRSFADEHLRLTLSGGGVVRLPISALRFWATDPAAIEWFRSEADSASSTDLILVRKRDGGVTGVEAVIEAIDSESVRLSLRGEAESVQAPWSRIAGIRFYRGRSESTPYALVTQAGRFAADDLAIEGDMLHWSSAWGTSGSVPLSSVNKIDLSQDRVLPVSALGVNQQGWHASASIRQIGEGHVFDKSLRDRPLELRFSDPRAPALWPDLGIVRQFEQGVSLRGGAWLQLTLPPGAKWLKGWVGVDPATAKAGDAIATIEVDQRTAWSGRVTGATKPTALILPLSDAKNLTLRVDPGVNLDAGDCIHFANLRVIQ